MSERTPALLVATASISAFVAPVSTGRSETTRRIGVSRPAWVVVAPRSQTHPRISCPPKRTITLVPTAAEASRSGGTR